MILMGSQMGRRGHKVDPARFTEAWNDIAAGAMNHKVAVATGTAKHIRRLQAGGWQLDRVLEILAAGESVYMLPDNPAPVITRTVDVIRTVPAENLMTARLKAVQRLLDQVQQKRDMAADLAEKVTASLTMKRKEVQEQVACPGCGESMKVTTTILHPLRANIDTLLKVLDGATRDEWTALGLPYGGKASEYHSAMWVPRTTLEDLRTVIASSLESVVRDGTITADQGQEIWERFKRGALSSAA